MKIIINGFGGFRVWKAEEGARPSIKLGTVVKVRYRNGSEHLALHGCEMAERSQWDWDKSNPQADIVAYSLPLNAVIDGPVTCSLSHGE